MNTRRLRRTRIAGAGDVRKGPVVVYARYFVHAISDDEEHSLLELAKSLLVGTESCLAVEFRTHRDQAQPKVTSAHFRRFVDPSAFICRAAKLGFSVGYFVEGFGLAKYKQDDAHVARIILKLD